MVSRLSGEAVAIDTNRNIAAQNAIALTDGHQRTFALAVGWPSTNGASLSSTGAPEHVGATMTDRSLGGGDN